LIAGKFESETLVHEAVNRDIRCVCISHVIFT